MYINLDHYIVIMHCNVLGKNILPKGADVVLALGKVHRNKKYWPNPLVFDPDRFLPERLENSQSYYYMPFSNGPRNCIGTYE